jgi:cell division protein FtsQ
VDALGWWTRSLRLGVAMCTLAAVFSFPASSVFALRSVTVTGTRTLSESEIRRTAGLRPGTPLVWIDPDAVARRLRALPRVRDARVELRFPHEVRIHVVERTPAATVRLPFQTVVTDREGVVLGEGEDPEHPLLVADGFPPQPMRAGRPIPWPPVRSAVRAVVALPQGVQNRITFVRVDPKGPLDVQLPSGVRVRVRPTDELAERLTVAEAVVERLRERGIRVAAVDLRFGDRVVVRPLPAGRSPHRSVE